MVNLIPKEDWMELEEVSDSISKTIEVPEHFRDKSKITIGFRVISVGPGYWEGGKFITPNVKVGDEVLLDAPLVARFTFGEEKRIAAKSRNVAFIVKRGGV